MYKINLFVISVLINLLLLGSQLTLSFTRSFQSRQVSASETQLNHIKAENQQLRLEVFSHSAISNILDQAKNQKLNPVKFVFWTSLPVALLP